ncbi:glycosyltransferase family 4 protein [Bacteroides ovatus]|uniref:glycosyltransferase family 4 protein n=1 Tax=Bacteroides ovatus TaxID=28116 RepID=UPI00189B3348|nr:glycosyltransferase family 4 protein [Bacteroides ovatus]MDC2622707.1 glycosyltransferase family 4 protein [Bacteroides ovatus]MDC2636543.1 glycosyltransferase family 4 protein [Bacteroides ovatus]MDC2651596.1 glycosyltransferase family 4 protein [Bacteroides ovatus]
MKKIKIFLGGFVNYLAAQNINCRSLSEHLNKEKFEVYTILYPYPNANDFVENEGVHYIKMNKHLRSMGWVAVVKGIIKCDVVYWCKWEYATFSRVVAKILGKKYIKTVEGILAESDIKKVTNPQKYLNEFKKAEPYLYAITNYIRNKVGSERGFKFAERILYLGVETDKFLNTDNNKGGGELKNIVFIGNNLINKGIEDFFNMSQLFPELDFHIIGTNVLWHGILEDYLVENRLNNVYYHGRLNHTEMAALLRSMDLMYFTSRVEGFPKVQLEAACAGCPTLCYSDYGANEWITTGVDGYVVDKFQDAVSVIKNLQSDKEMFRQLSQGVIELGKRFDWKVLVKTWEDEFERIFYHK